MKNRLNLFIEILGKHIVCMHKQLSDNVSMHLQRQVCLYKMENESKRVSDPDSATSVASYDNNIEHVSSHSNLMQGFTESSEKSASCAPRVSFSIFG